MTGHIEYLTILILFVGLVWGVTKYVPMNEKVKVVVWIGSFLLVALWFPKVVTLMEGLNEILVKMFPLDKGGK